MAETRRYYWLKLPKDFFENRAIKKLRTIAGGDTYTIIYLKMLLKSLEDNGRFIYEGIEDNIAEEIALDIDEKEDDVQVAMNYLTQKGLMVCTETEAELTQMPELIGSEGESARRMRKLRMSQNNQKLLQSDVLPSQCDANVTKSDTDKDIDKELDKDIDKELDTDIEKDIKKDKKIKKKYGTYKHVLLTDEEHDKLNAEYANADEIIEYLDSYIEEKGYKANSHYLSIKRWVVDALKEKKQRKECLNGKPYRSIHVKPLPDYMNEKGEANIPKEEYTAEEREKDQEELAEELRKITEART